MKILGIGGMLGHDSNAALIIDNKIVFAAQEERYTRVKHDHVFPHRAISDCLQAGAINAEDIDIVVLSEKPFQVYLNNYLDRASSRLFRGLGNTKAAVKLTRSFFEKEIARQFPKAGIRYAWHHYSHAISTYYSSGFTEAAFLCIDGKGEFANASIGYIDRDNAVISHELSYANGLGMLYTLITHFLGFPSYGSEYKVMGLAPYGRPRYVARIRQLFREDEYGAIRLLKKSGFHPDSLNKLLPWVSKVMGIDSRKPGDALTGVHTDIAASLQFIFEEFILKIASFVKSNFNTDNLLFCGGCAQNCVAAGKLRDRKIFEKVYNSPVGGDMASGLGAALAYLHQSKALRDEKPDFKGYYLGGGPGKVSFPEASGHILPVAKQDLPAFMAGQLAEGKIIGWVQGGMELGARALGARSILASPLVPDIQSDMNLKIKFRESFRPFAPAILSEDVSDWFDIDQPSDYMQYTAFLKKELRYTNTEDHHSFRERLNFPRCKIPSVVHVDYSARLQTVTGTEHPEFHRLLTEFKKIAGVPVLINTSFNVNGQPIVRTADEAWECFINTDIDLLVTGDVVYQNPFHKTRDQKLQWLKQFENYSR
ncbi:carbamoyltransferase [Mucilaginibacter angelicae]|uniref:Carbamoyltransferase n=1 Tax=Mucilaginibacter angelicae TaxID=869718 RepID=A0ABV6L564_9SPHI